MSQAGREGFPFEEREGEARVASTPARPAASSADELPSPTPENEPETQAGSTADDLPAPTPEIEPVTPAGSTAEDPPAATTEVEPMTPAGAAPTSSGESAPAALAPPMSEGAPESSSDPSAVSAGGPTPLDLLRPVRHRLKAAFTLVGLAVAAFATGLFVFNNLIMPRLIHGVPEVRVPDLSNRTLEQAEQVLRPLGLALSRAGERFDANVPAGFILSQDPAAETAVRGKKRVTVVVSLGEEFSSVPALFGESLRSARYLLERAGLKVGGITRAPSEEVGEGLVADSDPPAESVLPRGGAVSLLVSSGLGEESFVMPDLLGREINGARRQLESLGFRVSTPAGAPTVGAIVNQDPPAGSRITRSTPIMVQATGRMIR